MKKNSSVAFVLLVALVFPASLYAQSEGRNITLVRGATGALVKANADGTQETSPYVVPQGQELCVRDIVWNVQGAPGADVTFGLFNTNTGGVDFYQLWQVDPTLNSLGLASGMASFQAGPQITANGGLSFTASPTVTAANFAVYAIQRPLPTPATPNGVVIQTPCFP